MYVTGMSLRNLGGRGPRGRVQPGQPRTRRQARVQTQRRAVCSCFVVAARAAGSVIAGVRGVEGDSNAVWRLLQRLPDSGVALIGFTMPPFEFYPARRSVAGTCAGSPTSATCSCGLPAAHTPASSPPACACPSAHAHATLAAATTTTRTNTHPILSFIPYIAVYKRGNLRQTAFGCPNRCAREGGAGTNTDNHTRTCSRSCTRTHAHARTHARARARAFAVAFL